MSENNRIDLVEFPAANPETVAAARTFYESAFGWSFTSYGDAYVDTSSSGTTAGINGFAEETQQRMPLVVIYSSDLQATREAVLRSGGELVHDTYEFPGGRRFHFCDPAGNELAVWSE